MGGAKKIPLTEFGEWITEQFARAGYGSLAAFAAAIGVNRNSLWHYLHGTRSPKPAACKAMAKALALDAETVLLKAGLLSGDKIAPHRTDMGQAAAPLPRGSVRAMEGLMVALLADPDFQKGLREKGLTGDDVETRFTEVIHHLDRLSQRVADLESERLRSLAKKDGRKD